MTSLGWHPMGATLDMSAAIGQRAIAISVVRARKGQRQRKRNEEAEFGVAGGHGAFPYVSGPGMKLSDRGGRPSEAGADGGMGRSTIACALLRPRRPAAQAAGWLTE